MTHQLLGSVLSPFSMKVALLLTHGQVPFRWLPAQAGTLENLVGQATRFGVTRGLLGITYPEVGPLSEWPLVPFLFGPAGARYYDSSAIGVWLHEHRDQYAGVSLLPEEPGARFLCHLVDEFMDELGLYVLHHQRWVRSARSYQAMATVRREYRSLVPMAVSGWAAERFAKRQVHRLAYLFSVAPEGFSIEGLAPHRQPKSRASFPETHTLLDALQVRINDALTSSLAQQPFLFGGAFSLADASAGGILCSHLDCDPETAAAMATRWPHLHAYAQGLRAPSAVSPPGAAVVPEPLVALAVEAFLPFLQANSEAYERHGRPVARDANEPAYWRGDKLFDGTLLGFPYRTVVKTFQVAVLQDLQRRFQDLGESTRMALIERHPGLGPHLASTHRNG
jgi:glutathione S-transferase